jgi:hypothetical protein
MAILSIDIQGPISIEISDHGLSIAVAFHRQRRRRAPGFSAPIRKFEWPMLLSNNIIAVVNLPNDD